jgi:hypothetical protein
MDAGLVAIEVVEEDVQNPVGVCLWPVAIVNIVKLHVGDAKERVVASVMAVVIRILQVVVSK